MVEFVDPRGDLMVPLCCDSCGAQIGVQSPGFDRSKVEVRCYACAAVEEAEEILGREGGGA